ncbi:MAG: hypothetical protein ACI8RD_003013 [Bacillariaceae sp.]|jgi:hypothetical protein
MRLAYWVSTGTVQPRDEEDSVPCRIYCVAHYRFLILLKRENCRRSDEKQNKYKHKEVAMSFVVAGPFKVEINVARFGVSNVTR